MKGLTKIPLGDTMVGITIGGGRGNGVETGFGLFFRKVGWKRKRWILRKPRKTQCGQFKKRRKPMQNIETKIDKKKKQTDTHTYSNKRASEIFVSFS